MRFLPEWIADPINKSPECQLISGRVTEKKKARHKTGFLIWCRHQESNSGPTDYKSVALPTELYRHTIEIKTVFAYNTQSKGCHTIQLRIIIC